MEVWNFRRLIKVVASSFVLNLLSATTFAAQFDLPANNQSLIGKVDYIAASRGETPAILAQRYNLGMNSIIEANPGASMYELPRQHPIKIATKFILPPVPRSGIVVNLPEMRMYYFPKGSHVVMTYPIGIGKIGKTIPIQNTAIWKKVTNPVWVPPEDIRKFDREQLGIDPPKVMPPGPDNPLGPFAIYLRIPTFLMHSTIYPESIGTRASFGCIRMNETDIKQFFPMVKPGTPVTILDMPTKIAWNGNKLYMESHPLLAERSDLHNEQTVIASIKNSLPRNHVTLVNWQLVSFLSDQPDGVPHEIGVVVK